MSIGSISSGTGPADAARLAGDPKTVAGDPKTKAAAERTTIADHVAAADEHAPIRSGSETMGTLVDTYL